MENQFKEVVTPQVTSEQTEKNDVSEVVAKLQEENKLLSEQSLKDRAQKEHWREKYERDMAKAQPVVEEADVFSDEGKLIQKKLDERTSALAERLEAFERKEERREIEDAFPVLKNKRSEFDDFLEDEENRRISVKKAAKLFLAENNLLDVETPQRKGLEQPSGGGQVAPKPEIADDELEDIRKNDYRKYEKLIRSGK